MLQFTLSNQQAYSHAEPAVESSCLFARHTSGRSVSKAFRLARMSASHSLVCTSPTLDALALPSFIVFIR